MPCIQLGLVAPVVPNRTECSSTLRCCASVRTTSTFTLVKKCGGKAAADTVLPCLSYCVPCPRPPLPSADNISTALRPLCSCPTQTFAVTLMLHVNLIQCKHPTPPQSPTTPPRDHVPVSRPNSFQARDLRDEYIVSVMCTNNRTSCYIRPPCSGFLLLCTVLGQSCGKTPVA